MRDVRVRLLWALFHIRKQAETSIELPIFLTTFKANVASDGTMFTNDVLHDKVQFELKVWKVKKFPHQLFWEP